MATENVAWVDYHENGNLSSQGHFKNDEAGGYWIVYYENGQLQYKGDF